MDIYKKTIILIKVEYFKIIFIYIILLYDI